MKTSERVRRDETPSTDRPTPTGGRARPTQATHCVGIVTGQDGEHFTVASGGVESRGRRAVSCLLEPAVGDSVACLIVAPDQWWILAVLQREEGTEHVLRLNGPTRIDTGDAPLSATASAISLESASFALKSARAEVQADEALLMGRELRLVGNTMRMVGAMLSTVFDRVTHYSKHHTRKTEGIDRVSGTHVEIEAQQLLRQKAEHVFVNGDKLVKTTSAQVQIG